MEFEVSHCGFIVLSALHSAEPLFGFERHIAHSLFVPEACIHPQPICLSVLCIVISLQPELYCITATEIYQEPRPSRRLYKTRHRPGLSYGVGM